MKYLLLTGFEPFADDEVNPSQKIVEALQGEQIGEYTIVSRVLPVVFEESFRLLQEAIREVEPRIVICLGLAGGRGEITPERVTINVASARIADNKGNQPMEQTIVPEGPTAYWSTLPIQEIVAELNERGVPASISNTAGTYVCNDLFYRLMHEIHEESTVVKGGFIHVPYVEGQKEGQPMFTWEQMVRGIRVVCEVAVRE